MRIQNTSDLRGLFHCIYPLSNMESLAMVLWANIVHCKYPYPWILGTQLDASLVLVASPSSSKLLSRSQSHCRCTVEWPWEQFRGALRHVEERCADVRLVLLKAIGYAFSEVWWLLNVICASTFFYMTCSSPFDPRVGSYPWQWDQRLTESGLPASWERCHHLTRLRTRRDTSS